METKKFVFIGAYAGKTISIGSLPYNFVNGEITIVANKEEMWLHANFLKNWQAYPEDEIGERNFQETAKPAVSSAVQPKGRRA